LQQRQQFLPISLKSRIVVIALEESGVRMVLREEEMVWLLLEPEGVDELLVFLEIVGVAQEEDYLVDVGFLGDG
jgi:hypothetical protein